MLQPVLVRPLPGGRYELIAGERRWRAAQLAGLEQIPAIVRHDDDAASLELALIENMAREDLNPVEEARACAALVEELGLTREEVGRRVGRSRVAVSNLVRLLDLPDEALELLRARRAQRGPRPRAAARRTTTTPAAASPAPPPPRAGRCASWSGVRAAPASRRRNAPARRFIPTRRRPPHRSPTPSAGHSAPTCASRRTATATASNWRSTRSTRRSISPAAWASVRSPDAPRWSRRHATPRPLESPLARQEHPKRVQGRVDRARQVAVQERVSAATVGRWRRRFVARRLDGLVDEPRPGQPRKITDERVEEVIVKTLETVPPDGGTHWSTRQMAVRAR